MSVGLRPYPAYKDSGVSWLGQVPEHWRVLKLRHVLRQVTARGRADLPLLSVVREKGVILRDMTSSDENHNCIPDDLTNHKVVRKGQFAMNKMKAWQGSYGVSRHDGIVSPAYFVFDVDKVDGAYFHSAIRSKAYVPFFGQASDGVRIGQWDLSQTQMKEIPFFSPPLTEETAIVRYLDHMDRRIRRYVRAKQKLITFLEEQKQIIVHEAVTRGVDPTTEFRESEVDWLGRIPQHWSEMPLKRFARIDNSGSYGDDPEVGEVTVPVATTAQIGPSGHFYVEKMPLRGFSQRDASRYVCRPGDILVVKSSGSVFNVVSGKAGIVRRDTPRFVFSNFLLRVVPIQAVVDPEYMFMLLSGYLTRERVKRMVAGTTYPNLRVGEYTSVPLPLPPLDEQRRIVAAVHSKTAELDQASAKAQSEIDLLREYRVRLTADVVTGKLDVREAAASLPDEASKAEPLEDEVLPTEETGLDELADQEAILEEVEG